jgi:glycine cleavage system protein P-like pyridoxal-binding family
MLIDVAIPGDRNVIKKEAEKILKYKDMTIEIQRMWEVKTGVIPVIIGATGTISTSFRKYINNIPGNHEVKELQKTAILGTAHVLERVPEFFSLVITGDESWILEYDLETKRQTRSRKTLQQINQSDSDGGLHALL